MDSTASLDALAEVFDRYPAFVRLLVDHGDWWRTADGGTRFRIVTEDLEGHREASAASAAALGMEIDELRPDDGAFPDPDEPPMTYQELRAMDERPRE